MADDFFQSITEREASALPGSITPPPAPATDDSELSFSDRVQARERMRLQETMTHGVNPELAREGFLVDQLKAGGIDAGQALGSDRLTFGERFDLGLSDTFAEKQAKFLDQHPEGAFEAVREPGTDVESPPRTILFRKHADEPFSEMDPNLLRRFELFGDISDMSGDLPAFAVETAVTRGGRLATQMGRLFLGNITGDTAKELLEASRQYQLETFPQQRRRILSRGFVASAGGALSTIVTGPLNTVRGAASVKMMPGAEKAQEAARELKIPPFLPSQIAASPIIRRIGMQSQATVRNISEYIHGQQEAAVGALSRLRDEDALRLISGGQAAQDIHDRAADQILNAATFSRQGNIVEAGTALQQGIKEYEDLSQAAVSKLYEQAQGLGDATFDVAPILTVTNKIKNGMLGASASGQAVQLKPPTKAILQEIERIEKLLSAGSPQAVRMTDGRVISATDQMRALRENLWNLKQNSPLAAPDPVSRETQRQAGEIYGAITHALKNPTNADPAFRSAWEQANSAASKRFDTLEKLIVIQAARTEETMPLAARLAKPLQAEKLEILKTALEAHSPGKWAQFQRGVAADFIDPRHVDRLTQRLIDFDKPTLDLLLPRPVQQELKGIGLAIDRVNQVGITRSRARQDSAAALLRELTDRGDTAGLNEFISQAERFAPNSPQRRIVRAGIIEDVWNRVTVPTKGGVEIDARKLVGEVQRIRDSNLDKLLTRQDMLSFGRFNDLALFLRSAEDPGTSIAAAQTAAGLRGVTQAAWTNAITTLAEVIGTGRFFTGKLGQRILVGKGGVQSGSFPSLRVLGAMILQTANDVEEEP